MSGIKIKGNELLNNETHTCPFQTHSVSDHIFSVWKLMSQNFCELPTRIEANYMSEGKGYYSMCVKN